MPPIHKGKRVHNSPVVKIVSWLLVMPGYIHHIEWCVSDLQTQVQKLVSQYGFQPIGQRIRKIQNTHWVVQQVAVQSGDTIFIITQKSRTSSYENQHIGKLTLCISLIFLDPTGQLLVDGLQCPSKHDIKSMHIQNINR